MGMEHAENMISALAMTVGLEQVSTHRRDIQQSTRQSLASSAGCAERQCPFANSWSDTPKGDLNNDGVSNSPNTDVFIDGTVRKVNELWQGNTAGEAHYPSECADRGICDRLTGKCECFAEYEGSACQRSEFC